MAAADCIAPNHRQLLRGAATATALVSLLSLPVVARADEPAVPPDISRLVLDTGRPMVLAAESDLVRFQIHGEYQGRFEHLQSFPLDVSANVVNGHPRAAEDSLGQNDFYYHWLRITPRLQIKDRFELVGQLDVVTGLALGDVAHDTSSDQTPRDERNGFSNVQPRWLYAQVNTAVGVIRVGQQPSHWGMGILANDGDHPSLFGDYRYGSIDERVLFATKPGGKESPITVAVAGDVVFRDANARLTRGEKALQGVLAAYYEQGPNQIGVYAVYRHQTHDRTSGSDLYPYADTIDAGVLDVAGKFVAPLKRQDALVFGSGEAAAIFGTTNAVRTLDQTRDGTKTALRSYGGAMQLGVVHLAHGSPGGNTPALFGDLVAQIELGYASGDADPNDGVERRFVFDPNHKVGLLLFDEVLRFQTARASSAAQDPLLQNGNRPTPGVDLLPSNGGVFGAQYINPTLIVRPRPWLDIKGGMVVAQTTADVVDPYRLATSGAAVNYRGGNPKRHDLGMELDVGTEARIPLDFGLVATIGAQAGLLLPGGALANGAGEKMKAPWIAVGRAGFLF